MANERKLFGLVDADMLSKQTRHPNLALLKIAGYLKDHKLDYYLITDDKEDVSKYYKVYISRVFTFTDYPDFYKNYVDTPDRPKSSFFKVGGTGEYATITDPEVFKAKRREDMLSLEHDPDLPGLNMCSQMPDYDLYKEYVEGQIKEHHNRVYFKDYLDYSIGFLTRGCFRHCPFCVNKNETKVVRYSKLSDFVDESKPYIYLWDDNFFAAPKPVWEDLLTQLVSQKKPFQFRQGLDIRLMDDCKAELLSKARYHGDMIFAFDNWGDREIIEKSLRVWKKHCPTKTTKFYLFCGFELTPESDEKLLQDVCELFWRIRILMKYGCLGYVMRHEDYKKHPLGNIYTQIARWCNQPQFYKKMSFHQFIDRNQDFAIDKSKKCMSLRTYEAFMERFSDKKDLLDDLFDNVRYESLIDKHNWE